MAGTKASCIANISDSCTLELTLPGSTHDASKIAACASAYQAQSCDELFYGGGSVTCTTPGTLADAASCVRDAQCQSGSCDEQSDDGCGTCEALPGVGQTCTCKTQAFLGQSCGPTAACGYPMKCVAGQCQKAATSGPCSTYKDCDFWQGAWCTNGQCTQMTIAKVGEACNASGTFCEAGAECDWAAGVCVAFAKKSQACASAGPDCDEPYDCVGGTCALPNPALCP
jgi:hypothetical protein